MIRRSFRIGLTLGLLAGLAFALAKMLGGRPDSIADRAPANNDPWPPLQVDLVRPASNPAPVLPDLEPEPLATEPTEPASAPADRTPVGNAAPTATVADKIAGKAADKIAGKAADKIAAKKAATSKKAAVGKQPPAAKASAGKKTVRKKALIAAWVEPKGDVCPTTHPVKAKLASKIFHLPGMLNYARTKPDRCYRDAAAAESDDLRPAKR